MTCPTLWKEAWTAALVNHLWQSTAVVLIAGLLAYALRRNHAWARYWVWMVASTKFLVPFSAFIAVGEKLHSLLSTPIQRPELASVMEQITQPFPQTARAFYANAAPATAPQHSVWPLILLAAWLCGVLVLAFSWARNWWRLRSVIRTAEPMTLLAEVPVRSSPGLLEPGVFGIMRPVLVLPQGITERLSAAQLGAIIAHEISHVRRRDNLTAAKPACWKSASGPVTKPCCSRATRPRYTPRVFSPSASSI